MALLNQWLFAFVTVKNHFSFPFHFLFDWKRYLIQSHWIIQSQSLSPSHPPSPPPPPPSNDIDLGQFQGRFIPKIFA